MVSFVLICKHYFIPFFYHICLVRYLPITSMVTHFTDDLDQPTCILVCLYWRGAHKYISVFSSTGNPSSYHLLPPSTVCQIVYQSKTLAINDNTPYKHASFNLYAKETCKVNWTFLWIDDKFLLTKLRMDFYNRKINFKGMFSDIWSIKD